jgi:hypothetical protein
MPHGPGGDAWALPDSEPGVPCCPTSNPLASPEAPNFNSADGGGLIRASYSFLVENGLSPPGSTLLSTRFPQEVVFPRSASLSTLAPYPLEDRQEACPPAPWPERGMFQ